MFDASRIRVENRAPGACRRRTFLREGLWEKVRQEWKPGDFVIMPLGHNDGGPVDEGRARATIQGDGGDSKEVASKESGTKETVHTCGWRLAPAHIHHGG